VTQATQALLLLFFIMAGSGALVVFSVAFERRKMRDVFAALITALNGTLRDRTLCGKYRGIPFTIRYSPGNSRSSPSCHVTLKVSAPGRLTIRKEDPFDQMAKHKGLAREVQTGDAEFDRCCYVDTDDPQFARRFLDRADRRNTVKSLLLGTEKAETLMVAPTGIDLWIHSFKTSRLEPGEMTGILERLVPLSQDLPEASAEAEKTRSRFKPLLALTIMIFVAGDVLAGVGLTKYPPLDSGIAWIGVLCFFSLLIPYLWLAYRILKGTSSSHTDLGLIAGLSLFAFAPLATGCAVFANGHFDMAPRSTHVVTVKETRSYWGKKSTVYELVHDSWQRPGQTDGLSVDRAIFEHTKVGDRLTFTVGQGLFGFRWQAGYALKGTQ